MRRVSGPGVLALKVILPIATLAAAVGLASWLVATRPDVPQREDRRELPAVRAVRVVRGPVCVSIHSQGTVVPCTETTLVARVSGRIVSVSDAFAQCGFFREGEVLVQIEQRDYQLQLRRLEASAEAARAEAADCQRYLDRLIQLRKAGGSVTEVEFDRAKTACQVAEAKLAELAAQIERARNDLADTSVVAPFDGCIRQKLVDVGQFVTLGTPLATCFATDAVEVRLPVDDREFGLVGIELGQSLPEGTGPEVTLETDFAGRVCRWRGRIVRAEGFIDPQSRMVHLVARVMDPYGRRSKGAEQPLAVGLFVRAAIRSKPIAPAVLLPEGAVAHDGTLFLIDSRNRLSRRRVRVVWREGQWVVVQDDLSPGQRVCATRLEQPLDGMEVMVLEEMIPAAADGRQPEVWDLTAGVHLRRMDAGSEGTEK